VRNVWRFDVFSKRSPITNILRKHSTEGSRDPAPLAGQALGRGLVMAVNFCGSRVADIKPT
jgi:hypothetical protein